MLDVPSAQLKTASGTSEPVVPNHALRPSGGGAEPMLCEGLYQSHSGLPVEVERLAGGFTDGPEACPLQGWASWWRYQGFKI